MSDDRSRRSAAAAAAERLDLLIDDVARQMTAGEPASDLRLRVLARIDSTNNERPTANVRGSWFDVRGSSFDVRRAAFVSLAAAAAVVIVAMVVAQPFRLRESLRRTAIALATAVHGRGSERPALQVAQTPAAPAIITTAPQPEPRGAEPAAARTTAVAVRNTRATAAAPAPSDIAALAPAPIVAPPIDIDRMTAGSIAIPELETIDPIAVAPLATPEGERR